MQIRPQTKAFSLVELSIVLVILGLLVGGILAGQSLIRAAEIRSISTDFAKYYAVTQSFRDKYFALPGDMTNATSFWGSLGGTGADATCQNIANTGGTATCNGDGDGTLNNTAVTGSEWMRFWQHLANAGLIEGSYTGKLTGGAYTPGVSVPISKVGPTVFFRAQTMSTTAGTTTRFPFSAGPNVFFFWRTPSPTTTTTDGFPLKPEEAWNVDKKMDDGLPGTGTVISDKGNGIETNCSTAGGVAPPGDAGANYLLSNSNRDCALYFSRAI